VYKTIILSGMFIFAFAADIAASGRSPFDPRTKIEDDRGTPENASDSKLPSKAIDMSEEESDEPNTDNTAEHVT
jgi:hypothetical protein